VTMIFLPAYMHFYDNQWWSHRGVLGGWNPPSTLLHGHSRDLYRTNEKYFGY